MEIDVSYVMLVCLIAFLASFAIPGIILEIVLFIAKRNKLKYGNTDFFRYILHENID